MVSGPLEKRKSVKKSMITEAFAGRWRAFKVLDSSPIKQVRASLSWPILRREDMREWISDPLPPPVLPNECGRTLLSAAFEVGFF
jgi:hypothetical protein